MTGKGKSEEETTRMEEGREKCKGGIVYRGRKRRNEKLGKQQRKEKGRMVDGG